MRKRQRSKERGGVEWWIKEGRKRKEGVRKEVVVVGGGHECKEEKEESRKRGTEAVEDNKTTTTNGIDPRCLPQTNQRDNQPIQLDPTNQHHHPDLK